jgi:hypothetical protein
MKLPALLLGALALAGAAAAAPQSRPRQAIKPAVQARAKRIAIGLADLPGLGWHSKPAQSDRANVRCAYYDPDQSKLTENGNYTSPDFTRADGLYVSSTVGIFASAAQAKTSYGLVVRPALARCLGESVVSSGVKGHISLFSVGPLAFPPRGYRSAAYRIVFSVLNGGQRVPATIDLVAINKGAVDVALFFSSAGQSPPADMERRVSAAVAGRI